MNVFMRALPAAAATAILLAGCNGGDAGAGADTGANAGAERTSAVAAPEELGLPEVDTSAMQKEVVEAIEAARAAVIAAPENGRIWGELGVIYDAHHLRAAAEECYVRAIALEPGEFRWAYFFAIISEPLGYPIETTVARFEDAARLRSSYYALHARLGDVLLRAGRVEPAEQAYLKALERKPNYPIAQRGLGQALLALGDPAAALEQLEAAHDARPDDRATVAAMAQAYHRLGRTQEAEAAAEEAKRLTAKLDYLDTERGYVGTRGVSVRVIIDRARYAMKEGWFEEALVDLHRAEELLPEDPWVQFKLGQVYEALNQAESAAKHFERSRELEAKKQAGG